MWCVIWLSNFCAHFFRCHFMGKPVVGVQNGSSQNVGLRKFWPDLKIKETFCDRSQSLAFGWLCISEPQNVFLVSNFETWVLQSHNVLNLPFYTLSGTLRTESPSIFLDKSRRGKNLYRHPRQFFLRMLQIQIFLRNQSNHYRSIHCVCQQMYMLAGTYWFVFTIISVAVFPLDLEVL